MNLFTLNESWAEGGFEPLSIGSTILATELSLCLDWHRDFSRLAFARSIDVICLFDFLIKCLLSCWLFVFSSFPPSLSYDYFSTYMFTSFIDQSIYWLKDWSISWLIGVRTARSVDWLVDFCIDWQAFSVILRFFDRRRNEVPGSSQSSVKTFKHPKKSCVANFKCSSSPPNSRCCSVSKLFCGGRIFQRIETMWTTMEADELWSYRYGVVSTFVSTFPTFPWHGLSLCRGRRGWRK